MGLPTLFNSANQVAVPLVFSQGFKMSIPADILRDMERERNFEKNLRNKEREALCKAVANSAVQQALAAKQLNQLAAALKRMK